MRAVFCDPRLFRGELNVRQAEPRSSGASRGVPVALWQDEASFHVEVELPGVAEADVQVTLHKGTLYLRGERKPAEGRSYLYNSRAFGPFERAITLPEKVDSEGVQAVLSEGVLRVTLPKRPEAQPKRVAVQSS
jgi:HSP20 family protein